MYTPKHFEENDKDRLGGLIKSSRLASLVVFDGTDFNVNHIPFVLDETEGSNWHLRGHVPKANQLTTLIGTNVSCVAIFHGPSGYISPSFYASKPVDGKVVPTWNYAVVHCHGFIKFHTDPNWLMTQITDLTEAQEAKRIESWSVTDAPIEYTHRLVDSLVGVEVMVTRIEGKTKYSQNQPVKNQRSVLTALQSEAPHSELLADMVSILGDE